MDIIKQQMKSVSFYLNGKFWKVETMLPDKVTEKLEVQVIGKNGKSESIFFKFHRVSNKDQSWWQYQATNIKYNVSGNNIVLA